MDPTGVLPIRAGSFAALRLAQDDVKLFLFTVTFAWSWPTLPQRTRKGWGTRSPVTTHFVEKRADRNVRPTRLLADYEEMAVVLAIDFAVLAY